MGYIVGSCSDIPVSQQRAMWEKHGINVDFTVLKHRLEDLKPQFQADEYYLISTRDTGDYSMNVRLCVSPGGYDHRPAVDAGRGQWAAFVAQFSPRVSG